MNQANYSLYRISLDLPAGRLVSSTMTFEVYSPLATLPYLTCAVASLVVLFSYSFRTVTSFAIVVAMVILLICSQSYERDGGVSAI